MNPYPLYQGQYQYPPIQQVQTKICQRARGPHTEDEIYCGRELPINNFSKGRSQCKDCTNEKMKRYNEKKKEISTSHIISNHIPSNTIPSNFSLQLEELEKEKGINRSLREDLEQKTKELEEERRNNAILREESERKIKELNKLLIDQEDEYLKKIEDLNKEKKLTENHIKALNDEIRVLERKR